ncbi:MAG: hypothetical protein JST54_10150 [Deltaproteobacteria bacterium]|nr:hypothetical protein [Deltaproteobacteria bacterium]
MNGNVATLGGCQLFPADSWWNTDISQYPVSSMSSQWVGNVGSSTGMHPDFGTVWAGAPNGIPFVVVPQSQAMVPLSFTYASESDPGPYPVPMNAPIEGGSNSNGDRHVLVVQQGTCILYELYSAYPGSNSWSAGSGAVWDLSQNQIRPDGWTSADAAGLPLLPGLVKYDEVMSGEITHALRFTASSVQHAYIYPATHSDGQAGSDATHAPMGARFRLKASFDESGFPTEVQVILRALKKYGMFLADTGGDWYLSGAPDSRWSDSNLATLSQVPGSAFEVVDTGAVHPY